MNYMHRYTYQYATAHERGEFTVDEFSESIANVEAKLEVSRRVNPANLLTFDLVSVRPAS